MGKETANHGYPRPDRGATDWNRPLNERASKLDTDVEIRDVDANRQNYVPKNGAKFHATDTNVVYLGDGSNWNAAGKLGGVSPNSVVVRKDDNDVTYAETTDGILFSGTDSGTVLQDVIDDLTTVNGGAGGDIVLRPGTYLLNAPLVVKPEVGLHTAQGAKFANNLSDDIAHKPCIIFENNTTTRRLHVSTWGKNGIRFGDADGGGDFVVGHVTVGEISETAINGVTPSAVDIADGGLFAQHLYTSAPGGGIGVKVHNSADVWIHSCLPINHETGVSIKGSETVFINNIDIDSAAKCGIRIDGSSNINLRGTVWFNASTYSQYPDQGLAVGLNRQANDIYWTGLHLGHGGTGIDVGDVTNFHADVLMAGHPGYWSDDRGIETGIDYTNASGSNISIKAAMKNDVSTFVKGTPEGVLNNIAYEAAGEGGEPRAAAYVPGRLVENTDDNTLWWKDLTGRMRQLS